MLQVTALAVSVALLAALVIVSSAAAGPDLEVTITSGPAGTTASRDATFTFSANEPADFACSLDGAAAEPCSSPKSYSGLPDGDHVFVVQATNRDAFGALHRDEDTHRWTITQAASPSPAPPPDDQVPTPPDGDGDGVADGGDECPDSPQGLQPLSGGCSATELAADPDRLVEPAQQASREALRWLKTKERPFRSGLRKLRAGQRRLAKALDLTGDGRICAGARSARRAAAMGAAAVTKLSRPLDRLDRDLVRRYGGNGDAGPGEAGIAGTAVARALLSQAAGQVDAVHALIDRLCGAVAGPLDAAGVVAEIDDATGFLVLNGGGSFALADGQRHRFAEGAQAHLQGIAFHGGGGVITGGSSTSGLDESGRPIPTPKRSELKLKCFALRIAPVQPFSNAPEADYVLHRPKAYGTSKLWLERGMRAAMTDRCSGPSPSGAYQTVRSARIEIKYVSTLTGKSKTHVVATEFTNGEMPARLPADIDPGRVAKLKLIPQAKHCVTVMQHQQQIRSCSIPTSAGDAVIHDVLIKPMGHYVDADYSRIIFELDTKPSGTFQSTRVITLNRHESFLSGKSLTFSAEGYAVDGGSTRPNRVPIAKDQKFAVYMDDFYTPGNPSAVDQTGADSASGLAWPRVSGKMNGKEFWFAVDLPGLARDRVSTCSGPDSYYRLPFTGIDGWRVSNGNFDDPAGNGHPKGQGVGNDQRYAFDFIWDSPADADTNGDEGAAVVAARPGTVYAVQEDEDGNSFGTGTINEDGTTTTGPEPPGYGGVGNFTVIRHDDGTFGTYWHTKVNSTAVDVGQRVRRGQLIALSGNTGNSSQPHLHWDVRTDWDLGYPANKVEFPSKLVKLEDKNHSCWRPLESDQMASNNG